MKYTLKFFNTHLNGIPLTVLVREFPQGFTITFLNNEFGDFINSYQTKGFSVSTIAGASTIHLTGKLDIKTASQLWDDISTRLDSPDNEMTFEPVNE